MANAKSHKAHHYEMEHHGRTYLILFLGPKNWGVVEPFAGPPEFEFSFGYESKAAAIEHVESTPALRRKRAVGPVGALAGGVLVAESPNDKVRRLYDETMDRFRALGEHLGSEAS